LAIYNAIFLKTGSGLLFWATLYCALLVQYLSSVTQSQPRRFAD